MLDRDVIDNKAAGSVKLRRKLMEAKVGLGVFGYLHNAYHVHTLRYDEDAAGMMVNAASVITGYHYPHVKPKERAELLTPRAPIVVDYYPSRKEAVLVSQWDGTLSDQLVLPSA